MPFFSLCLLVFLAGAGCDREQAKRAAFDTLQNIRVQRCDERLVDGCPEGEKFDTYQRQRQEVLSQDE